LETCPTASDDIDSVAAPERPAYKTRMQDKTREGLLYALACYVLWGLVPLYFRPLTDRVPQPEEILAHRIIWSLAFLAIIVTLARRWRDVAVCLRTRTLLVALALSSLFIVANWYVYLWCVVWERITHASLGYFLTPLVSVLLGMAVFRERPRPLQWAALALALAGVARLLLEADDVPWLGLTLALSFGFYGLVRKLAPVDGLIGLSVETIILTPIALGYLLFRHSEGTLTFGNQSLGTDVLIACGGVVTSVPLLCFGQAARRLSLTTLGFFQYLSPSLQFALALAFGEPLTRARIVCFLLIWAALAVFSLDSWRAARQPDASEAEPI
jgi:chloramphenicol-sensitive protein RarD